MKNFKWFLICLLVLFVILGLMTWLASGECKPSKEKYGKLAVIDWRGWAYPFGRLNFDDGHDWQLRIYHHHPIQREFFTKDKAFLKKLQSIRYACPGGDLITPNGEFEILRDGTVIYRSGFFYKFGLQNREFGFLAVPWSGQSEYIEIFGDPEGDAQN